MALTRRTWLSAAAALGGLARPAVAGADKTLRLAFAAAETGFDPAQISDVNSALVASAIFEPPLTYDYLARPVKLRPKTAVALPEISADFKTFTFRIRPGIFFADDPAFGGRPRELVAQDYVYSVKRFYDPRLNCENIYVFENAKLRDLSELRAQARKSGRPFDYDREVEGIRALDRYTFRIRLAEPNPRFHFWFTQGALVGAVAREVVEHYGAAIAEHPVGTGPFMLAGWRRASRIELVRNPRFREEFFAAEPAPDDAEAQAVARQLAGRRLPLAERIEASVIIESQPRWLAFVNGALDVLELPVEFTPIATPGNRLAPNLARQGVRLQRNAQADMVLTYFNMDHPLVGGNAPQKVALRRAICLAYDNRQDLDDLRHGQGIQAQSVVAPFTSGYEDDYRSTMSEFSVARAVALLDLYGYVDRDGDGWREQPDGRPLVLRLASLPDQRQRQFNELWRKCMTAVGLRIEFDIASWPDLLKMGRAGKLMMWGFSWVAGTPDGGFFLGIGYGPNSHESNDAHFSLPAYDRLFERQNVLPDGPERAALMREAKNMMVAYMPYKAHVHRTVSDVLQPRVIGHLRHPFMRDTWQYIGIQ